MKGEVEHDLLYNEIYSKIIIANAATNIKAYNTNQAVLYALMLVAALAMIIFALLYLHNRFATKYRDLGIIALLFLLLFAGTQYEKYVQLNTQKSQAIQIVPFIKSIAKDENVSTSDVLVS